MLNCCEVCMAGLMLSDENDISDVQYVIRAAKNADF